MKVRYTPEALRDLQRISASIMEKFNNETVEKRVLKNITGAIRGLEVFPYKGVEVQAVVGVLTDYRYIFNEKNYVFYRIEEEEISIIRILNEKQDYMRVLFGISEVEDEERLYRKYWMIRKCMILSGDFSYTHRKNKMLEKMQKRVWF